jgi:hypothetical protein
MDAMTTTIEREHGTAASAAVAAPMPPADRFMRRLLRLPLTTAPSNPRGAERAMTTSLLISAGRCILMYLVFPFVLPAVGLASGVGHGIGLVLASVAVVSIVMSMRRFWRASHPKRWHYTVFGSAVLLALLFLQFRDLASL